MAPNSPSKTDPAAPLRIWRLSDGRAGHDNQSLGLTEALCRATACRVVDLPVGPGLRIHLKGLSEPDRTPDLLIGAGRKTQLPMLVLRARHGGRSIVIMKPGWPRQCFDLCLIPDHDDIAQRKNVVCTRGVLNRCQPGSKIVGQGLVLIGGPSSHFDWNEAAIEEQLAALIDSDRYAALKITDSPRTPDATRSMLARVSQAHDKLRFFPFNETDSDWLAQELSLAEDAWVSRDSMSMLYEALSGGCRLGILEVPPRRSNSRVVRASEQLLAAGHALLPEQWLQSASLPLSGERWAEAQRCAGIILERWFKASAVQ